MHYLYIPQQNLGYNTQIILEEAGKKKTVQILGKKNKQFY